MSASYIDAVYDAARSVASGWKDNVPALPDKTPYLLRFKRPSVEVVSPPASPAPRHSPPANRPPAKRARLSSRATAAGSPSRKSGQARVEARGGGKGDEEDEDVEDEEAEGGKRAQTDDARDEAALIGPRVGDLCDVEPYPVDIEFGSIPRMAVLRPSPLTCVNQDIVSPPNPPSIRPSPSSFHPYSFTSVLPRGRGTEPLSPSAQAWARADARSTLSSPSTRSENSTRDSSSTRTCYRIGAPWPS